MEELLKTLVDGLVENKQAVSIKTEQRMDGTYVLYLNVDAQDMGRVIGKQGKIAKAIRTVMRAAAAKENKKILVQID